MHAELTIGAACSACNARETFSLLPRSQEVVCLLHVAQYYGAPRLVHMCEVLLARVVRDKKHADDEGALDDSCFKPLQLGSSFQR